MPRLTGSGPDDPFPYGSRRLPGPGAEISRQGPLDGDPQVNSIEQRAAEAAPVPVDLSFATAASPICRSGVAARTRVGRGHEHHLRREDCDVLAADDADVAILERLAQRLEARPGKLAQLVEEEDAEMGEGRLAGRGDSAAADEAGRGDRMVRRPERSLGHQPTGALTDRDTANPGGLDRLLRRQRREDRRQAAGKHRLACARWSIEQQVVTARSGDL